MGEISETSTGSRGENLEAYYGLPQEVKFCKICTISNQRPSSVIEQKHTIHTKKNGDPV